MKDKSKSNNTQNLDPSARFRQSRKLASEEERNKAYLEEICKATDSDIADVEAGWNFVREKYAGVYGITIPVYHDYEMYRMGDEELDRTVSTLKKRNSLRRQFRNIYFDSIDYCEHIDELEVLYSDLKDAGRLLLTETVMARYLEVFKFRYPEIINDKHKLADVVLDYRTLHDAAGFSDVDYKLYDLYPKTLNEKLSFAPRIELTRIINEFNSPDSRHVLDDKYNCYRKFSRYYGRKVISVKSIHDSLKMALFCRRNQEFVKKPVFALAGKGVDKVKVSSYSSIKNMILTILHKEGEFVAEELVQGHPSTSVFNADSLNTFRIVTFNAGKQINALDESGEAFRRGLIKYMGNGIYCCAPFFKTGRSGSFVDNAGAGGVFTAISLNDGSGSGLATGEDGTDHIVHPDTGVSFESVRFDSFFEAADLAKELALQIPEVRLIGWDFALNEKGKWLLIEANYAPTLIGQAPARFGLHNVVRCFAHYC